MLDTKQRLDSYINEDGGCISMKTKEISHWEQFCQTLQRPQLESQDTKQYNNVWFEYVKQ